MVLIFNMNKNQSYIVLHHLPQNYPHITPKFTTLGLNLIEDGWNWGSNMRAMWQHQQPLPVQGGGANARVPGVCGGSGG